MFINTLQSNAIKIKKQVFYFFASYNSTLRRWISLCCDHLGCKVVYVCV